MQPVFVDFSTADPRTGNAKVRAERSSFAGDHLALGADAAVTVEFEVPREGVRDELTLKVRALVSKLGPRPGYAPLRIEVNEHVLVRDHRIPGGGDLPQEMTFAVPKELLRPGHTNTLVLRSGQDARSVLWLYRVLAEPVWDRDEAERAWLADSFAASLLSYRTDRRAPGTQQWEPAADWRLHIDGGEGAMPSRLDWRVRSGAEASVCFALELHTFYGHMRDADGRWYELRGTLTGRQAFPGDADPAGTQRFATEAGWGGLWHQGGPLTFHLAVGEDSAFDRVAWADQRACSASIGLTADGSSFQGWSQRVNEGPVGYRGTALRPEPQPTEPQSAEPQSAEADPAAEPDPASGAEPTAESGVRAEHTDLATDLDELGKALTNLADTAVKSLGAWWRAGR